MECFWNVFRSSIKVNSLPSVSSTPLIALILVKLHRDWGGCVRVPILRCSSRPVGLAWDNSHEGHIPNPRINQEKNIRTHWGQGGRQGDWIFYPQSAMLFSSAQNILKLGVINQLPALASCFLLVNPRVLFLSRCSVQCNLNGHGKKNIKKSPSVGRDIFCMFLQ